MEKPALFKPIHLVLIAIYFISGACSLMYEVIWRRMLKLILGNTTYATAITVAVFMGGLALGAYLMRKRADNVKNKLLVYGIIEGAITVMALVTMGLLQAMDGLYQGLFGFLSGTPGVLLFIQIVISALVLLVPSSLMGATLPLLSSWLVENREQTGFKTGILYSFNTFGALFGASLSGFFLIRLIGVYPTYFIALGGNIMIAGAAVVLGLKSAPGEVH
jgi:spermidine synthase